MRLKTCTTLAVAPAFPPLNARFPALSNTSFQSTVSAFAAVAVDAVAVAVIKDDDDDDGGGGGTSAVESAVRG